MTLAVDTAGAGISEGIPVGPRLPRLLEPRTRLQQSLLASDAAPLILVRAPIGFGKTTLIAQHLRTQSRQAGRSAVWLRISADTADGDRFWGALLDALRTAGVAPAAESSSEPTRILVRRMLTSSRQPLTLVLDDADNLAAGLDHELLSLLREAPSLRLIVCLRGCRHFRPASRLDIDTVSLDAQDLRFTEDEIAHLLRLGEVDRSPWRAEHVLTETDGWPELVRGCVLALQADPRSCERTGRSERDEAAAVAADFLRERVLPAMGDASILDFALALSVTDSVTPELAELLDAGRSRSVRSRLDRLTDEGLLVLDAADTNSSYRWPPAVRRVLQREAKRRMPARDRDLHRIAAQWFFARGEAESALRHAAAASDWTLVVRTMERFWENLVLTARPALIEAFGAAPGTVIDASVLARLLRSITVGTTDRTLWESLPTLPEDPVLIEQLAHGPGILARIRLALATMVALRVRGHHARASEHARRLAILTEEAASADSPTVAPRLPGLLLQVGITHLWAGTFTAAHRAMRRAYDMAPYSPARYVARDASGKLALLQVIQGHTDRAALWLDRHENSPHAEGWLEDRISTCGFLARAWSALDRLDLPAAASAMGEVDTDALGGYEVSATTGYVEALYRMHTNRPEEALHELTRVIEAFRGVQESGSLPLALLLSLKADLLLALGRGNHARAALTTMPEHPFMRVPRARMLLLNADPSAAIAVADDFMWLNAAPPRLSVEMLVIKAVAQHRSGELSTATTTLSKAISAAAVHQLRRPFTIFGHDELLEIARELPTGEMEWLRAASAAQTPFPLGIDLVHLTPQEHLILRHLAAGDRAQEIAAELFLSYHTVRTYQRHIYKKLDAHSRDQAVAQAHAYGLIGV